MTAGSDNTAIRAALATAGEGDGIGCHYRLRAETGLTVEVLAALGLVRPIRQRIPTCDEHPCPLRPGCRFAPTFAAGRAGGRSGKKFRLAPVGEAALRDDAILRDLGEALTTLPLARRILAALAAAGGTLTIFALNTALIEEDLNALLAGDEPGEAGVGRGDLAAGLALLAARGAIEYDGRRATQASHRSPTGG